MKRTKLKMKNLKNKISVPIRIGIVILPIFFCMLVNACNQKNESQKDNQQKVKQIEKSPKVVESPLNELTLMLLKSKADSLQSLINRFDCQNYSKADVDRFYDLFPDDFLEFCAFYTSVSIQEGRLVDSIRRERGSKEDPNGGLSKFYSALLPNAWPYLATNSHIAFLDTCSAFTNEFRSEILFRIGVDGYWDGMMDSSDDSTIEIFRTHFLNNLELYASIIEREGREKGVYFMEFLIDDILETNGTPIYNRLLSIMKYRNEELRKMMKEAYQNRLESWKYH